MLHFNYTLDNELKVAPDRLPSGIQTQAFEMAMNRMGEPYRIAAQMLARPVPGMGGASAIDGMSPGWQERIRTESAFLAALPGQLLSRARFVALAHGGNAVAQSSLERNWNRWVDVALKAYGEAVAAFQKDVSRAMANGTAKTLPVAFKKVAMVAKVAPPMVPGVTTLQGLGHNHTLGVVDDPAYLAGLDQDKTPLFFGALAGLSLVGLAGWYFTRPAATAPLGGCPFGDCGYY